MIEKKKFEKFISAMEKTGLSGFIRTALLAVISAAFLIAAIVTTGFEAFAFFTSLALFFAVIVVSLLPFKVPRHAFFIQFVVTSYACFFLLEWFTHSPWTMAFAPQMLNFLLSALIFGLLIGITGRGRVGFSVGIAFFLLVGIANYYTMAFRDSPILPWDLLSLRTAVSVTDNYVFAVSWNEVRIVLAFLLLAAFGMKSGFVLKRPTVRMVAFACCLIGLFGSTMLLGTETVTDRVLISGNLFSQWATYRDNGFLVSFTVNLKYLKIDKPDGYSAERADAIITEGADAYDAGHLTETEKNKEKEKTEDPNIIVVMNESFSDLSVLHEFGVSDEYMPFYNSCVNSEDFLTGSLYVSVLGGNTANTEFEFLTGCSMAFLPSGSVPYQQYIKGEMPGLTEELAKEGYETMAVHPYHASGWNRDTVYPDLGFMTSYFLPDFNHAKMVRKYVSDETLYEFVEEKAVSESPVFTFAVTMQNHGGYSLIYDNFPVSVHLTEIEGHAATENYLSLIRESDRALEELIGYYETCDEPTMIVFFGDHQPSDFVADCIADLTGTPKEERSLEETENRYIVPYLIWANFSLKDEMPEAVSANFLGAEMLKLAGVSLSDYEKYLLNLMEQVPVITADIVIGQDGEMKAVSEIEEEEEKWFKDYQIVCYRRLFDAEEP